MWQRSRALRAEYPQMIQRRRPRNVSRWSILLLNEEVVDKSGISRSSQPYPAGGPFVERGSGNVDRSTMIAD